MLKRLKTSVFVVIMAINMVIIAIMLMLGYGGYLSPANHPVLATLTLGFPALVVANAVFLCVWMTIRWRWATIPLLGFLLCYDPIQTYFPIHRKEEPPKESLEILSYNVENFAGDASDDHTLVADELIEYLTACGADIICLQESMQPNVQEQLKERLPKDYQEPVLIGKAGNMLTLISRFPVLQSKMIDYESGANLSVATWLRIGRDTVVVVNNHLESNLLSKDDKDGFQGIVKGRLSTEAAKGESRHLIAKLSDAARRRAPQADAVHAFVDSLQNRGQSVIVCGDLNDHPLSYVRRIVGKGLTDCYKATGCGPGWSYHKSGIHVRIDHIFCSDDWEPCTAEVDSKIAASDHYPIRCWLKKRLNR